MKNQPLEVITTINLKLNQTTWTHSTGSISKFSLHDFATLSFQGPPTAPPQLTPLRVSDHIEHVLDDSPIDFQSTAPQQMHWQQQHNLLTQPQMQQHEHHQTVLQHQQAQFDQQQRQQQAQFEHQQHQQAQFDNNGSFTSSAEGSV